MATAKTQDRGFLNFFWDLASEDSDKRVKAGEGIVAHLTAAKSSGKATVNDDIEYALKRLIRGLSSSREAARQGFAGCLCELLKSQQQFDFDFVVKLLDESTQITGSMKGNEERDALFGKLFGCLCLIRAGMVDSDGAVKTVLDTLLDVQTRKPWIREVCAEALLLLVSECSDPTVVAIILPPVVELIGTAPMEDLSAWQLQLIGGIELAVAAREGLHAHVAPALRHLGGKVTSAASLPTIAPTLVAATSGFPKIHRVYGTLLAGVFRSDKDRVLLPERCVELSPSQEQLFRALSHFMSTHLNGLKSSHEKRSVAYHLGTQLFTHCPVSQASYALPRALVRSLMSAAADRKHTLHALARRHLAELVAAAGADPKARLALVGVLVTHGSADFDARTKTHTVAKLLQGLDKAALGEYVGYLCAIIGKARGLQASEAEEAEKVSMDVDGDEAEDDGESADASAAAISAAHSAISALAALARNARLSEPTAKGSSEGESESGSEGNVGEHKAYLAAISCAALMRLSCVSGIMSAKLVAGLNAPPSSSSSSDGKKGKKEKKGKASAKTEEYTADALAEAARTRTGARVSPALLKDMLSVIASLEESGKKSEGSAECVFDGKLVAVAGAKLQSTLGDLGSLAVDRSQVQKEGQGQKEGRDEASSLAAVMIAVLHILVREGGMSLTRDLGDGHEHHDGCDHDHDHDHDGENECAVALESVVASLRDLRQRVSSRIVDHLTALLTTSTFHVLASEDVPAETLQEIASNSLLLADAYNTDADIEEKPKAKPSGKAMQVANDDDDEQSQGAGSEHLALLDACVDLLSVPQDHSIKGVRDCAKKLWTSVAAVRATTTASTRASNIDDDVLAELINMAANIVCGEESEGRDDGDDDEEEMEEEEDEDDEDADEADDDDDEEEEQSAKKRKIGGGKDKNNASKKARASESTTDEDTDDDEDDEDSGAGKSSTGGDDDDVYINEGQAFSMLAENDNSDDEEDYRNILQHGADADAALVQMLKMRQDSRKAGILQAMRHQLLIRNRGVDLLEALVSRCDSAVVIVPLLKALVQCIATLNSDKNVVELNEGAALQQRLKTFIDSKILPKKIRFANMNMDAAEGEEGSEEVEEVCDLINTLLGYVNSHHVSLRLVAQSCIPGLARTIIANSQTHTTHDVCLETLRKGIQDKFQFFITKKNSRMNAKLFDDLLLRHADFATSALFPVLGTCISAAASNYLSAEGCRLATTIVRRGKGLGPSAKSAIVAHVAALLSALASCIEKTVGASKSAASSSSSAGMVALSAKKLKPVLVCVKETVAAVNAITSAEVAVAVTASQRKTIQDAVKGLADTIATVVQSFGSGGGESGSGDKKDGKRQQSQALLQALKQASDALAHCQIGQGTNEPRKTNEKNTKKSEAVSEELGGKSKKRHQGDAENGTAAALSEKKGKKGKKGK